MDQTPALNAPAAPGLQVAPLLSASWRVVLNSPGVFLGVWAATSLPATLLVMFVRSMLHIATQEDLRANPRALIVLLPVSLFTGILNVFAFGTYMIIAKESLEGRAVSAKAALSTGLDRLSAIIWTTVVSFSRIFVGGLLLLVPGIIMLFRYSLSLPAAALDNYSGMQAVRASRELVLSRPKSVLWFIIVKWTILLVIGLALTLGLGLIGAVIDRYETASTIFSVLVGGAIRALIVSWSGTANVALYQTLRGAPNNIQ